MLKKLLPFIIGAVVLGLGFAAYAYATTFQPYQGGTGYSTSSAGTVGQYLQVSTTSPFLGYTFATPGFPATATINGVTGPTFTVSFVTTSSDYSITTNTAQLFLNILASSTWLKKANNLSELTNTSTARTNIGYTGLSPVSISSTGTIIFTNPGFITTSTYNASTSISVTAPITGGGKLADGSTINIACGSCITSLANISSTNITASGYLNITGALTDSNGNKYSTSTGGSAAGSDSYVQYNNGGAFGATSTFTFSTSSQRLTLGASSSSLFIGTNANFATSSQTTLISFSYTGATSSWQVPAGVTSITINVQGASASSCGPGTAGNGGSATGTLSVTPGTTYFYGIGGQPANATGGFSGGGNGPGACGGGGMTWIGTASTFSTSTAVLVGAGGGGVGANSIAGGNGGGLTGSNGSIDSGAGLSAAGGGTQTAGGTAGSNATAGSAGQGGNGTNQGSGIGGGGGGGYFGGGGGAAINEANGSGGGAGGSSYMLSTLTSTSTTSGLNTATGTMQITYMGVSTFSTSSAALYVGGHILTGNQNLATTSVSSCGTSPLLSGVDSNGNVTVGSGLVTSCKINFGSRFQNTPNCTLGIFSTAITGGIGAETTSSLTVAFSASLAGGQFNYICLDSSE